MTSQTESNFQFEAQEPLQLTNIPVVISFHLMHPQLYDMAFGACAHYTLYFPAFSLEHWEELKKILGFQYDQKDAHGYNMVNWENPESIEHLDGGKDFAKTLFKNVDSNISGVLGWVQEPTERNRYIKKPNISVQQGTDNQALNDTRSSYNQLGTLVSTEAVHSISFFAQVSEHVMNKDGVATALEHSSYVASNEAQQSFPVASNEAQQSFPVASNEAQSIFIAQKGTVGTANISYFQHLLSMDCVREMPLEWFKQKGVLAAEQVVQYLEPVDGGEPNALGAQYSQMEQMFEEKSHGLCTLPNAYECFEESFVKPFSDNLQKIYQWCNTVDKSGEIGAPSKIVRSVGGRIYWGDTFCHPIQGTNASAQAFVEKEHAKWEQSLLEQELLRKNQEQVIGMQKRTSLRM